MHNINWLTEHGLTSAQHNLDYTADDFLQVKRPNQQCQSTEGESYKGKQPKKHTKKTQKTRMHRHTK